MILRRLTDATKVADTELSAQREIRAHLRLDIDDNHLSLIAPYPNEILMAAASETPPHPQRGTLPTTIGPREF
jgi:hypothetical protein